MKKDNVRKDDVRKDDNNEKYIKILAYFTFFYFGIRFILSMVMLFAEEAREQVGMINIIFSPILCLLGIYLGYKLLKKKRWALFGLFALIIWTTLNALVIQYFMEEGMKFPTVQIVYIVFLIMGLRFMKKEAKKKDEDK